MLFRGAYDNINGVRRPYVTIRVRIVTEAWISLPFLVDSGADATFLDASCLKQLGVDAKEDSVQEVRGVGGQVSHIQFTTALRFESPQGAKNFTGTIGIFTDPEACDTPVLGQDVLDSFCLILDRDRNRILLLSSPHDYDVVTR